MWSSWIFGPASTGRCRDLGILVVWAVEKSALGRCCAACSGGHFYSLRRPCTGGATTGPLPTGDPPFRLPSSLSRRSHNWSATNRRSSLQASVEFISAEPQLVRYQQAILPSGFRRVYLGGATTGPLPTGDPPFRLPSSLSRRSHNWSATDRPCHTVGRVPNVPSHRHALETQSSRGLFRPRRGAVLPLDTRLGRHTSHLIYSSRPVLSPPG